ncbi:hypothetical protein ScPMuIL_011473 [Solemya velum]
MDNNIDIGDEKPGGNEEGRSAVEGGMERRTIPSRAFPHFQPGGSAFLTAAEVSVPQQENPEVNNDHESELELEYFSDDWGKSGHQDEVVYNSVQESKMSDQRVYARVEDHKSVVKPGFDTIISGQNEQNDSGGDFGCCGYILWALSMLVIIITFPFSLCLSIKVVQEYERAVIFRLGRLVSGGAKGPGLFFIIPCMDSYTKVDLRTVSFDVPPQEVLTKDSVTVAVDAVVYYRVQNATMSITNVENADRSTRLLSATTLRNVLGTKNLSEILSERESISHLMQSSLDEATDPWGVKVERVEVKDVRLPVQLQRAMAAEAEAAREARAKVIAAEGEQKASRALKEAADVLVEAPAALQLRYLQTLNTISAEKNSTIIFPLPIDLLQSFVNRGNQQTTF